MVALTSTNTKELREKAKALQDAAIKRKEEAPRNDNGVIDQVEMAACMKMIADSKALFDEAAQIDSGLFDANKAFGGSKTEQEQLDVAEQIASMDADRWTKPISIAMGAPGQRMELDLNNPAKSLLAAGLPEDVIAESEVDTTSFSKAYHQQVMAYLTRPDTNSGTAPAIMQQKAVGSQLSYCTPIRFSAMIQEYCREMLWMRQLSSSITVLDACSTGIIREVQTPSSAAWGDACKEPGKCELPKFELKTLSPDWMAYCASVCRLLLTQRCSFDIMPFIARKLAFDSAQLEEVAFFHGDGKKKPLGLFYDPVQKTDYCGGLAINDFESNCMFNCGVDWTYFVKAMMQLPECTRNNGTASLSWLFHKDIICQMMLMCDGNGRPIWLNDIQSGGLPTLFGVPVRESAHAPATFEPGNFWGVLGDFSGYTIADGMQTTLERDDDIKKNQACWVGRRAVDGMVTDPDKFVRLKCAAAEPVVAS